MGLQIEYSPVIADKDEQILKLQKEMVRLLIKYDLVPSSSPIELVSAKKSQKLERKAKSQKLQPSHRASMSKAAYIKGLEKELVHYRRKTIALDQTIEDMQAKFKALEARIIQAEARAEAER